MQSSFVSLVRRSILAMNVMLDTVELRKKSHKIVCSRWQGMDIENKVIIYGSQLVYGCILCIKQHL